MGTITKLNQFIDKELDPEEEILLSEEISNSKELQDQISFLKEVNESIAEQDILEYRQKISQLVHPTTSWTPVKRYLFLGIAAAIVLLFSMITFLQPKNIEYAFSDYYSPYKVDIRTRSSAVSDNEMNTALKLYQAEKYEAAYTALVDYTNSNSNDSAGKYYLGICSIQLNKNKQAESCLKEVINANSLGYDLHAKWYLAMVYLKDKQKDKALHLLTELADSDNYYSHDARKILKKYY